MECTMVLSMTSNLNNSNDCDNFDDKNIIYNNMDNNIKTYHSIKISISLMIIIPRIM